MSRLRFVLILFLSVALDLSVPMPSQASEIVEEIQEASAARRSGRPLQRVRDTSTPFREPVLGERRPASPRPSAPVRPIVIGARVQKIPPLGTVSSAPEDH